MVGVFRGRLNRGRPAGLGAPTLTPRYNESPYFQVMMRQLASEYFGSER